MLLLVAATLLLRAVPNQPGPAPGPNGSAAATSATSATTSAGSSTTVAPLRTVTVRYEVTGPGSATMAFTDGTSRQVELASMDLPWVHEELVEPSFTAAAVSGASDDPKVRLACRIHVDGKRVAGMTGLGSVSCVPGD
ncbi:MAG: MmpS family transport accessory protein [Pseudonocardia sp.]